MSFELAQPSLKIGLARVRSWQMPPELLMSTLMDTFWTPAVPGPFSHRDAQSLAPLGQLWRCLREPLDLTQMQEALQGVSRTDPAAASWRETSPALRPGNWCHSKLLLRARHLVMHWPEQVSQQVLDSSVGIADYCAQLCADRSPKWSFFRPEL